ncbi:unnamed protein product [Allacma fusca]|uniref:Uncharacterized protein n=1 Tax=Allacma fusca TaxID=39272 RepID=A0A8J2LEU6_9HEXA|nr:unnamed protein product [Allacma fusca]
MSEKTTRAMSKPVPMKLFSSWEVDRTPPNCIPSSFRLLHTYAGMMTPRNGTAGSVGETRGMLFTIFKQFTPKSLDEKFVEFCLSVHNPTDLAHHSWTEQYSPFRQLIPQSHLLNSSF